MNEKKYLTKFILNILQIEKINFQEKKERVQENGNPKEPVYIKYIPKENVTKDYILTLYYL